MAKVTGIGGVFFKSIHDSAVLKAILSVALVLVVCGLAAVVIINLSPHRRRVQELLCDWERPIYAASTSAYTLPSKEMT